MNMPCQQYMQSHGAVAFFEQKETPTACLPISCAEGKTPETLTKKVVSSI